MHSIGKIIWVCQVFVNVFVAHSVPHCMPNPMAQVIGKPIWLQNVFVKIYLWWFDYWPIRWQNNLLNLYLALFAKAL